MRLNFDCVRDILLCIEENTDLRNQCIFFDLELITAFPSPDSTPSPYQMKLSEKYGNDTVLYHINYCCAAGLLSLSESQESDRTIVEDLTPDGHSFLANIREASNWEKIKKVAAKAGSTSLPALSSIASQVIAAIIKQCLCLP